MQHARSFKRWVIQILKDYLERKIEAETIYQKTMHENIFKAPKSLY